MQTIQSCIQDNRDELFVLYPYTKKYSKNFEHILSCRNSLGAFKTICPNCGVESVGLTSCDDRNCPICANRRNNIFVTKQTSKLLPTNYYHITFTIPHILNNLTLNNQVILYNILFESATIALKQILSKKEYMGADKIGLVAILHTWGSNLTFHPHIHTCVAGCGLDKKGNLVLAKNKNYLCNANQLQQIYKGIFMKKLNEVIFKLNTSFDELFNIKEFLIDLAKCDFIVNIRDTMNNPKSVINYFARYANRVCISPSRILSYDKKNNTITFKYKDYKDNSKIKEMTLHSLEFLRRFSQHFLPKRFRKIREYGFMSPNNEKNLISLATKFHVLLKIFKARKQPILCKYCNKELNVIHIPISEYESYISAPNLMKIGIDDYEKLII